MKDSQQLARKYQLFINGKFEDASSSETYRIIDGEGATLCKVAKASSVDLNKSIQSCNKAKQAWEQSSPVNKAKLFYNLSEILESRFVVFVEELVSEGVSTEEAAREVRLAIDLVIYYSGWADKYQTIFSNINPVSSPHTSISKPEPVGSVGIIAPEESSLLGVLSAILPVVIGGNTCTVLASKMMPMSAITLAEALISAEIPQGVINILTGERSELLPVMISDKGLDSILLCSSILEEKQFARQVGADQVKRIILRDDAALSQSPYHILDFQETKTIWHPHQS